MKMMIIIMTIIQGVVRHAVYVTITLNSKICTHYKKPVSLLAYSARDVNAVNLLIEDGMYPGMIITIHHSMHGDNNRDIQI